MFDFIILILCIIILVKVSRLKEIAMFNTYSSLPPYKKREKRGDKNVSREFVSSKQ